MSAAHRTGSEPRPIRTALSSATVAGVLVAVAAIWWAGTGTTPPPAVGAILGDAIRGFSPVPAGTAGTLAPPSTPGPAPGTSPVPGTHPTPGTNPGSPHAKHKDGCDHGYGPPGVCVPWTFPPGIADKCEWLRSHGYPLPLAVHGTDRHGLDHNHNNAACDAQD